MRAFFIFLLPFSIVETVALAADQRVGSDVGAAEFAEHCAVCHGVDGTGDGPLASFLDFDTPDLTELQRANGGVFPEERVIRIIDGRAEVGAHGTREMPIWGYEYRKQAQEETDARQQPIQAEDFVTGRIISLVRYLESIQKK